MVVLAGLTNTYSSYITTFEEYQIQRYEGASTIFGPHTLDAYIQVSLHQAAYLHCSSVRVWQKSTRANEPVSYIEVWIRLL